MEIDLALGEANNGIVGGDAVFTIGLGARRFDGQGGLFQLFDKTSREFGLRLTGFDKSALGRRCAGQIACEGDDATCQREEKRECKKMLQGSLGLQKGWIHRNRILLMVGSIRLDFVEARTGPGAAFKPKGRKSLNDPR